MRWSLRVLSGLHQPDDLREGGIRADLGGAKLKSPGLVDGRAGHVAAYCFPDRHALARDHRLVHIGFALRDFAVHRNLVAGANQHDIVHHDFRRRYLHGLSIAHHGGLGRREVQQGGDRLRSPRTRAHLQPVTGQDEDEQHGDRFVEDFGLEEESRADAEGVAGQHRQRNQHRHVGDAFSKRPPGPDVEHPAAVENRRSGEEEHHDLVREAERHGQRQSRHLHEHGRVEVDQDGQDKRDDQAIAHVPRHRVHVVSPSVPHFMSHLRLVGRHRSGFVASVIARLVAERRALLAGRGRLRFGLGVFLWFFDDGCGGDGVAFWGSLVAVVPGRARRGHIGLMTAPADGRLDVADREPGFVVAHGGASRGEVDGHALDARRLAEPPFELVHAQYRQHVVYFNDARFHRIFPAGLTNMLS